MIYPEEFVKKVKTEYPDQKDLHEKLETGDFRVGNYLSEKSHLDMDDAEIIRAIDEERYEDVKKDAEKRTRRKKLYVEWQNLQAGWWQERVAVNC